MKPGARISAVIDLLSHAFTPGKAPFDVTITHYFKQRRYAGSQDRRVILEYIYGVIRNFYKLLYVTQKESPNEAFIRLYVVAYLKICLHVEESEIMSWFSGIDHAPLPLTQDEQDFLRNLPEEISTWPEWVKANVPEFLWQDFQILFGENAFFEANILNQEANVDLRVNLFRTQREFIKKSFGSEEIESVETPYSPFGLRLKKRINLTSHPLYRQGLFEFQDEASQLVSLLCDVQGGDTVLDYCAGAGGKTLALSMLMGNKGHIDAYDISLDRLKKAEIRAQRTGCDNISFLSDKPNKTYDRVLVDAPCSGMGTWRRHPEWRLTLTLQKLMQFSSLQTEIIRSAAKNVKAGGRLIYVTCSLLPCENEKIIESFLVDFPHFKLIPVSRIWKKLLKIPYETSSPFLRFTPYQHQTDGFFIAVFEHQ